MKARADDVKVPDPVAITQALLHLAERSQPIIKDFMDRVKLKPPELDTVDPSYYGTMWLEMMTNMFSQPKKMAEAQINFWQDYAKLVENTSRRMLGKTYEQVINTPAHDRRFHDPAWNENTLFDYLKQSYLLASKWTQSTVHDVQGMDPKTKQKIDFYTKQFVDAISPSNYLMTNPEVLRRTAETGGENLVKGLQNLVQDLERGQGELRISMTDMGAFRLGDNVATTPGKVIYQNDLIQLIQYAPVTETVRKTPLLIIPPWINKYYVLDLRPGNSLVRYCVEQGHTVFMISWVNPDERHRDKNFDDYMTEGALAAMAQAKRATGEADINVIGYCLGGTLLAGTLAYLARAPQPQLPRVKSATYFVALVDFSNPGDIGVFIDEEQVEVMEAGMAKKGYMDAHAMATTFNMLRANDLIWNFVVNNYLLGKEPFPFDLLYWNSDSTRMAAAMHSFYLRKMYLENKMIEPDGISFKGVPLDMRMIDTPSFILGTRDDHITPWRTVYSATQLYKGPVRFVLSGSGHIAGVINPPEAKKYDYMVNDNLPPDPEKWLEGTEHRPGSWWPEWNAWMEQYRGGEAPARQPGENTEIIEDAPGSYVKVRAI
ncbi:MAG: class I poly(R)-hydroxyalkanoic acid synthase [Alphaproteobacteria bacterium]|nr:class I poly(R)-hydroxyalkanoic acid synthase [Alphaproteobacteria bacterium]